MFDIIPLKAAQEHNDQDDPGDFHRGQIYFVKFLNEFLH